MKTQKIRCPYCGGTAVLRKDSFVYGNHAKGQMVYVCSNYPACDAYVNVHPGTTIPKGTLANKALRKKRIRAHQVFDQIWKCGILSRQDAYRWISDKLCLDMRQAHIGQFGDYLCDQVIAESAKVLKNNHVQLRAAG
ncbi:MAG: zinc-finger-containing protein [Eubacteriales bacterium]|nr:zinc-finger-containing protein [Eubacteriales bacterium]